MFMNKTLVQTLLPLSD